MQTRPRTSLASTALLGAVLLVTLGATSDICGTAAVLQTRQGQAAVRDADAQAMADLLARLTDAARDLHGKAATPAMPEQCLGAEQHATVLQYVNPPADPRPQPLIARPELANLPPPLA